MASGTYALEMKPTNIAETLQTVYHSMQPWAREKNIRVGLEILPGVPEWVITDPNRISQVLANFLSNALKFVDQSGNGVIQVQAFPIDQPSPLAAGDECCATDLPSEAVQIPVGGLEHETADAPVAVSQIAEPLPHVALLQWFRDAGTRLAAAWRYPPPDAALSPPSLSPRADVPNGGPSEHQSVAIEEKLSLPPPLRLKPRRRTKPRRATATSMSTIRNETAAANDDTAMSVAQSEIVDLSRADDGADESTRPASLVTPSGTKNRANVTAWVRFQVIDNGIGISPDALQRLWQPFFQVDAGVTQQGRGSGLGLSICKEIIRHHGGRVGVRSRPNAGSTFFAEIPFVVCRKPSSESMGSTATPGKSSVGTPGRGGDAGSAQGVPVTTALTQVHIVDHLVMLIVDDGTWP
jgi:hypothetical protein